LLGGKPRPQGVAESVVDPRAARVVAVGELHAGRQGGRDHVTIGVQPAVSAVMGALGQGLGDALPAQAVLGHGGRSGIGPIQAATLEPAAVGSVLLVADPRAH